MPDIGSICFAESLDARTPFGFAAQGVRFMSKIFCRLAPALFVLIFSRAVFGDDFKSLTISSGSPSETFRVHNGQFMVVRNFTQDDLIGARGVVTVTKPPSGTPVNVLTTATLDASPPDIINSVVIAGPADVVFTCGDTTGNCFVSYKKDNN
jgi:hypothetical protein